MQRCEKEETPGGKRIAGFLQRPSTEVLGPEPCCQRGGGRVAGSSSNKFSPAGSAA